MSPQIPCLLCSTCCQIPQLSWCRLPPHLRLPATREQLSQPWGAPGLGDSSRQAPAPRRFHPARASAAWERCALSSAETDAGQASSAELAGYLLGCQPAWHADCLCARGSRTSGSFRGADVQPKPPPGSGHESASLGVLRACSSSQGFPASLPLDRRRCGGCGCHQLPVSLSCWLCDELSQSPGDAGSPSVSSGGPAMKTEGR